MKWKILFFSLFNFAVFAWIIATPSPILSVILSFCINLPFGFILLFYFLHEIRKKGFVEEYEIVCPKCNSPLEPIEEEWKKLQPAWTCPKCGYSSFLDMEQLRKIAKVKWVKQ